MKENEKLLTKFTNKSRWWSKWSDPFVLIFEEPFIPIPKLWTSRSVLGNGVRSRLGSDQDREIRTAQMKEALEFPPYQENPLIKQYSAEYWILGDLMTPQPQRGGSFAKRVFVAEEADVVFVPFIYFLFSQHWVLNCSWDWRRALSGRKWGMRTMSGRGRWWIFLRVLMLGRSLVGEAIFFFVITSNIKTWSILWQTQLRCGMSKLR